MSKTSRRTFLKTSAAVAAATSTLSIARSAHAAGDDVLKLGLIGFGGRGRGAAQQRMEVGDNVKLVAVCDVFDYKAKDAVKHFNALAEKDEFKGKVELTEDCAFSGFDGYKATIDACDQILIATSPGFRPIHYKYAIEQGKHVFMEKPCCVDAPGYRMLMEANKMADEKKLNVMVGLQRRRNPSYLAAMEKIWDGAIGDLMFSRVFWNSGGVWVRDRAAWEKKCAETGTPFTEMSYQLNNWYYFNWLCGDHICEQHVHNLDIGNWAASGGDQEKAHPVEAQGMGGRQVRTDKETGQIFDHHFIEYTMADGSKMYSQCRHQRNTQSNVSEAIIGSKGECNPSSSRSKISFRDGSDDWRFDSPGVVSPFSGKTIKADHAAEHVDMALAIRGDIPHFNDGYFGAMSSFTAVMGRMATYSGKVIKWDDAVEKGVVEYPYDTDLSWEATPPLTPDEDGSYDSSVAKPGSYKPFVEG